MNIIVVERVSKNNNKSCPIWGMRLKGVLVRYEKYRSLSFYDETCFWWPHVDSWILDSVLLISLWIVSAESPRKMAAQFSSENSNSSRFCMNCKINEVAKDVWSRVYLIESPGLAITPKKCIIYHFLENTNDTIDTNLIILKLLSNNNNVVLKS